MAKINLILPTIQNWDCHNCGGCCKQHAITVTPEERKRIEKQNWQNDDDFKQNSLLGGDTDSKSSSGNDGESPIFTRYGGTRKNPQYRIAHRADGACLFLDEKGLCKIHAKFGEAAKPLACRIYPYAFHPEGNRVTVSLRFSCPSVVENKGKQVSSHEKEILKLAREAIPQTGEKFDAPLLKKKYPLDWKQFLVFNETFAKIVESQDASLLVRLRRAIEWLQLLATLKFEKLNFSQLLEINEMITASNAAQILEFEKGGSVAKWARVYFRLLAGQYGRKDNFSLLDQGWRGRWGLFKNASKLTLGIGNTPKFSTQLKKVPFAALEKSFGEIPEGAEEILCRYLSVKVRGIHYCGKAYYDIPFIEGAYSLILIVPAVAYLAKWIAAGDQREQWTTEDFQDALALADHHHGYSPAFGFHSFRKRIQHLMQHDQIKSILFKVFQ